MNIRTPRGVKKEYYEKLLGMPHYCLNNPVSETISHTACKIEVCECKCDTCGFNKAEADRRVREGHWEEDRQMTIKAPFNRTYAVDHVATGLKGLVFPKLSDPVS